jgi:hypothetical protein
MYPDDVAALFPLIAVGTQVRLINEPIKVAWVDGELLLEAHPPVDAQGQSFEPNIDQFADMLRTAVGDTTVAINWDYAREVLQKANGVIATVALEADDPNLPAAEESAGAAQPAAAPAQPAGAGAQPGAAAAQPAAAQPAAAPAPPAGAGAQSGATATAAQPAARQPPGAAAPRASPPSSTPATSP